MRAARFLAAALLSAAFAFGQQAYSPFVNPAQQFLDSNGNPLSGGKVYTYIAGTTTQKATYADNAGTVNPNPITLDGTGSAHIWLGTGAYRFAFYNSAGVLQPHLSADNVIASTGIAIPCSNLPVFTGDVTNVQCATTVARIQGRAVSSTAPSNKQVFSWNAGGTQWQPTTLAIGLSAPASIFSVSGSGSDTLGLAFATGQTANRVFGTDGSGAVGLIQLAAAHMPWTLSGNTTVLCSVSGSLVSGHLIKADVNGNCVDGGAPPSLPVIQVITGASSCSVASGASFNVCTVILNWPVAFADASYAAVCNFGSPSDPRVNYVGINSQTSTNITLQFVTDGSTGGTMSNGQCHGIHP